MLAQPLMRACGLRARRNVYNHHKGGQRTPFSPSDFHQLHDTYVYIDILDEQPQSACHKNDFPVNCRERVLVYHHVWPCKLAHCAAEPLDFYWMLRKYYSIPGREQRLFTIQSAMFTIKETSMSIFFEEGNHLAPFHLLLLFLMVLMLFLLFCVSEKAMMNSICKKTPSPSYISLL